MSDYLRLPDGLPVPVDDGACDGLVGRRLPTTKLTATIGEPVDLSWRDRLVLFVYPRTGGPGIELAPDWDLIPGARGCTPQSCGFRDLNIDFAARGFAVMGLSAQSAQEQAEFAIREHIPFPLVSDPGLMVGASLGLPTFRAGDLTLYKRVTLVVRESEIEHVFYPVFPPDKNAADVLAYLG